MRKPVALAIAMLCVALAGCKERTDQAQSKDAKPTPAKAEAAVGDAKAGRALAEGECKGCHGVDGKGAAPGIPHLAGQNPAYLLLAMKEYRENKRTHAALREIARHTAEADTRNVVAYYASLPPVAVGTADGKRPTPYDEGKAVALASCASCHGEDGNTTTPGVPSLAGQQPRYLVVATREYLMGERKTTPMHAKLRGLTSRETENVALYYASQEPKKRVAGTKGDPRAGEPLTAVCGGCHGVNGVSADTATPSLAGQDEKYLVESIKAYRTSRKRENMRLYITGLGEKEIADIAAFYASQASRAAEKGQTLVEDLTARCNRCHAEGVANPSMPIPRIRGQDRDYLVMALRAYRDDRRESSTMHKMSLPYGDSIIESIATYYASQPPK
ncbi:MAG TPA: c-type cytochrome [Usitatibacter sp.]|nr:c-type cytochrome [Usitatibacter sp.]